MRFIFLACFRLNFSHVFFPGFYHQFRDNWCLSDTPIMFPQNQIRANQRNLKNHILPFTFESNTSVVIVQSVAAELSHKKKQPKKNPSLLAGTCKERQEGSSKVKKESRNDGKCRGNSKPTVTVATKVNRRLSEFWYSHGEVKSLADNQDCLMLLSQSNVDNKFLQI